MLSVIKTAIITIIISFISGVLLDSYKNFAPRILCTMTKPVPLRFKDKKLKAYTLIIRNISNKTIHNLTLNVQGYYDSFKAQDPKITGGLKFEDSHIDNNYNYNVEIPFLSRNDEFSVKLFIENRQGVDNKPIVTLRSPEDFKRVDSTGHNGLLAVLSGIPKDICGLFTKKNYKNKNTDFDNRNKKLIYRNSVYDNSNNNDVDNNRLKKSNMRNRKQRHFKLKKLVIIAAGILILIYIGILGGEYYDKAAGKMETPLSNSNIQNTDNIKSKTSSIEATNSTSSTGTGSTKVSSDKAQDTGKDNTSSIKTSGNTKNETKSGTSASSGSRTSKNNDEESNSIKSKESENTQKNDASSIKKENATADDSESQTKKSSDNIQTPESSKNTSEKQLSDEKAKTTGSNPSPAPSPSSTDSSGK